jgi:ATP-dependent Clp protease ATP-binding subunit ClpC
MVCQSCNRRVATVTVAVVGADGTQRMAKVCAMCAHRLSRVPANVSAGAAAVGGSEDHLFPQLFNEYQFPTERYGVFMGFSQTMQHVLRNSEKAARNLGLAYIGTFPLLIGLLTMNSEASRQLSEAGIDIDDVLRAVSSPDSGQTFSRSAQNWQVNFSHDALRVLEMAQHQARGTGGFVEPEHLLLSMLLIDDCSAAEWMKQQGLDFAVMEAKLAAAMQKRMSMPPAAPVTAAATGTAVMALSPDSALSKYARDLTQLARDGKLMPVVGRDAELGRCVRTLSRLQKNNPILLGEAGVGKTAIVESLAQHIAGGDVPRGLKDCSIYDLDLASMIAGTEYRGSFEERMKQLIDEAKTAPPKILFINEIHNLVGAGATEGSMGAANIMKPALARGELHLIGATTLESFKKFIAKDAALSRRFQPVLIGEPNIEDSIEILKGVQPRFEEHHGVELSMEAISAAVTLTNQYVNDRFLPDKAIDAVDEACVGVAMENEESGKKRAVIADDVAVVVSSWTGIPLAKMIEPEKKRLLDMESILHERMVNQEEAVRAVSEVVRRSRSGLKDPDKPNGVFIFAGPTGVGKTELARALAGFLFDNDAALVRLDMSEYMEKESLSRLIGAPPGYIGYEEGGQLTEKIKFQPYSVVLFDEMEKAHPKVLNVLLQIADAGRLTDGQGSSVNFKNTIIILTTNLGAPLYFDEEFIKDRAALKDRINELIISTTSPEFFNRMDAVVAFEPLTGEQVRDIVKKQVGYLARQLGDQGIKLEVDDAAIDYLARRGFEPSMGARPAKRVIQNEVTSLLSNMIIGGVLCSGDTATVRETGGRLEIVPVKGTPVQA